MSNLPAIILVHGFWGGAAHWSKVILELKRLGHDNLHAVELPLTSLADDAERTRKMIAQQQGPVLLVGHSYGGAVITEAGNQPNVVGLVYIAEIAQAMQLSQSAVEKHMMRALDACKASLAGPAGEQARSAQP